MEEAVSEAASKEVRAEDAVNHKEVLVLLEVAGLLRIQTLEQFLDEAIQTKRALGTPQP